MDISNISALLEQAGIGINLLYLPFGAYFTRWITAYVRSLLPVELEKYQTRILALLIGILIALVFIKDSMVLVLFTGLLSAMMAGGQHTESTLTSNNNPN